MEKQGQSNIFPDLHGWQLNLGCLKVKDLVAGDLFGRDGDMS